MRFRASAARLALLGLVLGPFAVRPAAAQSAGAVDLQVFAGYAFSDLDESVVGVGASVDLAAQWSVAALASQASVPVGSLRLFEFRLQWRPFAGRVNPYLAAGLMLERASGGGASNQDQGYVFGSGVAVRWARVAVFGELVGLKNGAVSGQGRGGLQLRVR